MQAFTFSTTKTIINEAGSALRLPELCDQLQRSNAFIVTDPGLIKAGLIEPVLSAFADANIEAIVFSEVEADPSDTTILNATEQAVKTNSDIIIGFGGGSAMDVAKLVAVLAHPDAQQPLSELYGVGQVKGPRLPLIQVPTTAGTGSEVTPIAIVTTGQTTKAGVVSPVLQPDIAVLDAQLTVGLPAATTAATGIDAMVHAIEAYTSVHRKNPLSDMLAKQALTLLAANIRTAVNLGTDLEARQNMLLGALLAGQAFANAPVAAVHALAYPLGGHFHIPHGLSNSLVLADVMAFNAPAASGLYADLAPYIMGFPQPGAAVQAGSDEATTERLISYLRTLIAELGLPTRLRDCEVPESFLPRLATDAMAQQRLLVNNPRSVSEADALDIYRAAY